MNSLALADRGPTPSRTLLLSAASSLVGVVLLVSGCGASRPAPDPGAATTVSADTTARVTLTVPDGVVTAVLDDNPTARQLAAMLPLSVELSDPMGQALSGALPEPLTITGSARSTDPAEGGVYYWPPTAHLAIYYDDLGQTVPPPGLVRVGTVTGDLDLLAPASRGVTVELDAG